MGRVTGRIKRAKKGHVAKGRICFAGIRAWGVGLLIFVLFPLQEVVWAQTHVDLIKIDGVINPVAAQFIQEAIDRAVEDGARCLVIGLDTPGGLDKSMRIIVKAILSAKVPVVVYVWPEGARAASAGVWITLAAHIAAMAPGTNIGAAHPVLMGAGQVSKEVEQKVVNDAVAYIKAIAQRRGRNAQWAEKAVRESVSITEREALKLGVIDLIGRDLRDLLKRIHGRQVKLASGEVVLKTKGAEVRRMEMGWRYRVLDTISDPNIAYILLLLGIYGLFFELSNPGSILPGVLGAIFLILALFALQTLPINYAGLLLIILAIILFLLEVKITSYGLLTVGGIISMTLGSMMLIKSAAPFLKISWKVIFPAVAVTALFFTFALSMAVRAHRRKPTTGIEGLIGEVGVVQSRIAPEGEVFLQGEIWMAVSDQVIEEGEEVVVDGVSHLKLKVSKREGG